MGNVPIGGRVLPLLIAMGILGAVSVLASARMKKSFASLLKEHFSFCLLWIAGLIAIHLLATQVFYAKYAIPRLAFLLGILFFILWALVTHVVRRRDSFSAPVTGLITLVFSLVNLFILLECIFLFATRTHGYAVTFASMNWYYQFGGPYDAEGYRGRMINEDEMSKKNIILMLGDSFLAGSGVRNIDNRFSSLLEKELKGEFVVVNRGIGGHDTRKEYEELLKFKPAPKLILLSWIPDDILVAAESMGMQYAIRHNYEGVNPVSGFMIRHSYFFNFLYWSYPHDNFPGFSAHMKKVYDDPKILQAHFADLQKIKAKADSMGVKFAALLWPFLQDVKGAAFATEPVAAWLKQQGIPVLDLTGTLSSADPNRSLVVNPNDGHPNEFAHGVVAKELLKFLEQNGLITH